MRISIFLLALLLILSACTSKSVDNEPKQVQACTKEAKICPDGTVVSRQGPNCEFVACPVLPQTKTINTANLGAPEAFKFSATIPYDWEIEIVPEIESINFYDPKALGENSLEQSQIFVRYFRADRFLTLSTVTIYDQTQTSVSGRPAIVYDIEKNEGVANFPGQPSWRNDRHVVTDVRETDDSTTTFYVFGKRPDLDQATWDKFLNSLNFTNAPTNKIIDYDLDRISKKSFGTFVTPQNSPVSPERFTGYHTAVDFEYEDDEEEILVTAVMDGTVLRSDSASGYGGVVVIEHNIGGVEYKAVYGHLDPDTLVAAGSEVTAGEVIGVLGKGFTSETDGERKHLHFGLYKGDDINIKGYVTDEADLQNWVDPVSTLFSVE